LDYQKNQLKAALCLDKDTTKKIPENAVPNHNVSQHLYQIIERTSCAIEIKEFTTKSMVAVCLFGALINHSCAPNVSKIEVEDKVCFMVMRPIALGEQLFDCYTQPFFSLPMRTRQGRLFKYGFKCECEACSNPKCFTEFEELKINSMKLRNYAQDMYMETNFGKEKRLALINKFAELKAKITEATFPSQEYCMLRSLLKESAETLALRYRP
jgi:SET domain